MALSFSQSLKRLAFVRLLHSPPSFLVDRPRPSSARGNLFHVRELGSISGTVAVELLSYYHLRAQNPFLLRTLDGSATSIPPPTPRFLHALNFLADHSLLAADVVFFFFIFMFFASRAITTSDEEANWS